MCITAGAAGADTDGRVFCVGVWFVRQMEILLYREETLHAQLKMKEKTRKYWINNQWINKIESLKKQFINS